jgi:hypothetical protein
VTLAGISFTAGGVIVIDTTPGRETVTLNDGSIVGKVDLASRWPLLAPGANQLFVERLAGSGTPTGSVEWRDGWVS